MQPENKTDKQLASLLKHMTDSVKTVSMRIYGGKRPVPELKGSFQCNKGVM